MTIPPAAAIALRELIAKWRQPVDPSAFGTSVGYDTYMGAKEECADDLDALLARVEPPEESAKPESDQIAQMRKAVEFHRDMAARFAESRDELKHRCRKLEEELATLQTATTRVEPPPQEQTMVDAAEMLWVVLSNVSGSDWKQQSSEWQEAAARWRDNYFAVLAAHRAPPTQEPT